MRMARPQQTKNLLQKRLGKQVNGIYENVVLNVLNAGESVWGYEDVNEIFFCGRPFHVDMLITGLHHVCRQGLAVLFFLLWCVLRLGLERQEPQEGKGNHRTLLGRLGAVIPPFEIKLAEAPRKSHERS